MPAQRHHVIHTGGAAMRGVQATTSRHQLHHLLVATGRIGHVAHGEHLPQQDAEGPARSHAHTHINRHLVSEY